MQHSLLAYGAIKELNITTIHYLVKQIMQAYVLQKRTDQLFLVFNY